MAKSLPVARREVWVTRSQVDTLTEAIAPRYQALVRLAALSLSQPLNDGAVAGPGRLRVVRAFSDPRRNGNGHVKDPKSEARRRTIALDEETCDTFRAHREQFGDKDRGLVFTPGGPRGRGGALAANNFRRVWLRALQQAGLDGGWPEYGGLHFHDLRHSHATWLLALRYAHVDKQVDRGLLTAEDLGLPTSDDQERHGRSA